MRSRTRWRSRRRTRLRITAPPTVLGTTKPARAGGGAGVSGRSAGGRARWMTSDPRPARRPPRTAAVKSSRRRSRWSAPSTVPLPGWSRDSGRETGAPFGAAGGQDRAASAGTHAQPEAVGLRTPAVVRLEGALAHWRLRLRVRGGFVRSRVGLPCYPAAGDHPGPGLGPTDQGYASATIGSNAPPAACYAPTVPLSMWTAVERLWTTLLACPIAGLEADGLCTRPLAGRTGQGGQSFGTVYRNRRLRHGRKGWATADQRRASFVISRYTACGQPVDSTDGTSASRRGDASAARL